MEKKEYPKGAQVILESMLGEPQMPKGLKGIIQHVDDIGQIHVSWENGSSLALIPDKDKFEVVCEAPVSPKLIIIGRSGSGKDTIAKVLTEKYGLKQLKSYTTRPKRTPEEDSHIFVTKEEAALLTDRIAETEINGYQYFATRQQFEECDIYIIDPSGLKALCDNAPDIPLNVLYVSADPAIRRERALKRVTPENKEQEEQVFLDRAKAEDQQFLQFEVALASVFCRKRTTLGAKYPNVRCVQLFRNNNCDPDFFALKVQSVLEKFQNNN